MKESEVNHEVLVVAIDYDEPIADNTIILYRVEQENGITMTETMERAQRYASIGVAEWASDIDNPDGKCVDAFVTAALKQAGIRAELLNFTLSVYDSDGISMTE